MFWYNIKFGVRQIIRQKVYALLNILGLSIGLGCFYLIILFVITELSYNKWHIHHDRIYRVVKSLGDKKIIQTPYILKNIIIDKIPEIEKVVCINKLYNVYVKNGENYVKEPGIISTENEFFSIFSVNVIMGNPKTLLTEPATIVISEDMKHKYFSKTNPIGQSITICRNNRYYNLRITGVVSNLPLNSSVATDFITNIETSFTIESEESRDSTKVWNHGGFSVDELKKKWDLETVSTFVLLTDKAKIDEANHKLLTISQEHKETFCLQKLTDIHFDNESFDHGNIKQVIILAIISLLILLVACINFILLSTAGINQRFKETGIKKVFGANTNDLLKQLIYETALVTIICLPISLMFVEVSHTFFGSAIGNKLNGSLFSDWKYICIIIGLTLLTVALSGSYIGLYLSRVNPAAIFSKVPLRKHSTLNIRNFLLITQFIVFISLISTAIVIYKQNKFMLQKDMGYVTKNLLVIEMNNTDIRNNFESFKSELLMNPSIIAVAGSFNALPTDNWISIKMGSSDPKFKDKQFSGFEVDYGFIELMDFKLLKGRSFNEKFNDSWSIVVNESFVKEYDLKKPIGTNIGKKDIIVGVVKDFHTHSLHSVITPLIIICNPKSSNQLILKYKENSYKQVSQYLSATWNKYSKFPILELQRSEDLLTDSYKDELKLNWLINFFLIINLIISCMGLFGLTLLMTEKRSKEIGIRKVNGSQIFHILLLIAKELVWQVIIACIVAFPITWYAMHKWLQNFAYKTEISWWIFALAGLAAIIIALLTVSWQTWRAANRNPVEALRYE